VKIASTPNLSMNQRSLPAASSEPPAIAPACPTARVSLLFQRPTTQATIGFREFGVELVISARLDVEDRRLAARVVRECEREFGRGEMDVDVLAARDERRRSPAGHAQIGRDRRREVARVREDRDRALASASSGLSPPSAPPIRTLFHASATPRLLPPKMSMPFCCPIARISRES
jgi:hypothetical protein